MKARITTETSISLQTVADPVITDSHQVKIRIHRAALCRTDLYVADGRIPTENGRILGHEAAGEIIELGSAVEAFTIGDRVTLDPLQSCRNCPECHENLPHLCGHTKFMGIHFHGAFAEQVVIPANKVYRIPQDLDFDLAVYAEPIAATRAVLGALGSTDDDILIYGRGRISGLTTQILKSAGYHKVTTSMTPPAKQYPVVIEAIDSAEDLATVLPYLQSGGLLILKSRHPQDISLPLLDLVQQRIQIKAVHYSPFREALSYLTENRDFIRTLIGNQWSLESYQKAFTEARSSEALKTLFTLD